MDIFPEDFWMTYKNSWAPKPGWLSTDAAGLACRQKPARTPEAGPEAGPVAGKDRPVFIERRKKKPVSSVSGTSRGASSPSVLRPEASGSGRPLRGRRAPVQDADLFGDMGLQTGKMNLENVVVLRPRLSDYTYADFVLSALRSMFEAQAAGQKELLTARIKLVSHLLEDIGRRRRE